MEYKEYGNTFVVRLNPGDEIISSLTALCQKEKISLAHVSGLGAAKKITLGVFNMETKKLQALRFEIDNEDYTLDFGIEQVKSLAQFSRNKKG